MNKLILLNELRNEKSKNKLSMVNKIESQEEYNKPYIDFKEKFNFFQDNKKCNDTNNLKDGKRKHERSVNSIIERIFELGNDELTISFINSIYNDALSIGTKIKYIKNNEITVSKNPNYNIKILAQDEYRKFEYKIQFQTLDEQNLAIVISKKDLINNNNIVNFNKKKKEYEYANDKGNNLKESYNKCLIMLNSSIQVPDIYKYETELDGHNIQCGINIIKSWKYDFKQLFENEMYLLLPLKVIDLKKRLLDIDLELVSKNLIKNEILGFFRDMNRHFNKMKEINLISDKEINELNLIAIDLLKYLINEKNSLLVNIKTDIQATLNEIVV